MVTYDVLCDLCDDVTKCVECAVCESEGAVWVGFERLLVCAGEGDAGHG